jgi:hypothetical protein
MHIALNILSIKIYSFLSVKVAHMLHYNINLLSVKLYYPYTIYESP